MHGIPIILISHQRKGNIDTDPISVTLDASKVTPNEIADNFTMVPFVEGLG